MKIGFPSNWSTWVNQETPALEMSALDYVIEGDLYCRLQNALHKAIG